MNKQVLDEEFLFSQLKLSQEHSVYPFKQHGNSLNFLIEQANSVINTGLVLHNLANCMVIEQIYNFIIQEINAIEVKLLQANYLRNIILSYRYILCAFIDEKVMSSSWGANSIWAQHSLLTYFYNETGGGEKVFTMLQELLQDENADQEILEFIALCFALGFQGKYKIMLDGDMQLAQLTRQLHQTLKLELDSPFLLPSNNVLITAYKSTQKYTSKRWFIIAFIASWSAIFGTYYFMLQYKTESLLKIWL